METKHLRSFLMTREMNKPDWHIKWVNKDKPKQRELDEWIKPFFDNCCRMEKIER